MPRRLTGRPFVTALVVAAACSLPTDVCGCPPARSHVLVHGTLADAAGAPVAGARLYFEGAPADRELSLDRIGHFGPALTDAAGAFRSVAYSLWSSPTQELRVAVLAPGRTDTVQLSGGPAPFRWEGERPDSVRLTLRLP